MLSTNMLEPTFQRTQRGGMSFVRRVRFFEDFVGERRKIQEKMIVQKKGINNSK